MEPPPRATMSTSGRGTSPPASSALSRGSPPQLGRAGLALHAHRPHQHLAREAVLEPMQDVADHRAGGRGHHADHPR